MGGRIASQDRVKGDARASAEAGRCEYGGRDAGGAALAQFNYVDRIFEDRGAGSVQAVYIRCVGNIARIRDRLDEVDEARFKFGEPGTQSGCECGAPLLEGSSGCRCSVGALPAKGARPGGD
jgi:hypothetical protein